MITPVFSGLVEVIVDRLSLRFSVLAAQILMCFPCVCLLHDTNAPQAARLEAFPFILLVAGNPVDPGN